MIARLHFSDRILSVFRPTARGAVGLVDDLLTLCREHPLKLSFSDGQCYVTAQQFDEQETIAFPLEKSVVRAILARVAALCNERVPNSVTPYGGKGELVLATDPPMAFQASFTNTSAEQRLELTPLRSMTSTRAHFLEKVWLTYFVRT